MLKLYLQLEHARFSEKFDYVVRIDQELLEGDQFVPPMIVQPFLENAVWHGLRYREQKGELLLGMTESEKGLTITIRDNGVGVNRSRELKTRNQKKQNSVGMQNIHTRVALLNDLYQSGITIQVNEASPGADFPGTIVQIVIPRQNVEVEPNAQIA